MSFTVTKPIVIDNSNLVSYSVAQDLPIWNPTATYNAGDEVVMDDFGLHVYKSVVDSNLGNNPTHVGTIKWNKELSSNKAAMFDKVVGTTTKSTNSITLIIQLNDFADTVAILNIDKVEEIKITSLVNEQEVWSDAKKTYSRVLNSWNDVWFKAHKSVTSAVFNHLPKYKNQQLKIELIGSDISVGTILVGSRERLGISQWDFTTNFRSFSKITESKGVFSINKVAPKARVLELKVRIEPARVASVELLLESLESEIVFWQLEERFERTLILGIFKSFKHNYSNELFAFNTLKIEGVG